MNGGDTTAMAKYTLSFDFSTSFHFLMSTFSRYLRQAKHTIFDLIFDYTFCLPQMDYHSIPAKGGGGCDERKHASKRWEQWRHVRFDRSAAEKCWNRRRRRCFTTRDSSTQKNFTSSLQVSQSWFLILPIAKIYKKIFK